MYSSSTQKRFWIFGNKDELTEMRHSVNKTHIDRQENLIWLLTSKFKDSRQYWWNVLKLQARKIFLHQMKKPFFVG